MVALAGRLLLLASAADAGDEVCALQVARRTPDRSASAHEALLADFGNVAIIFTLGSNPYNLWQAELLFFSAQRVGQRGPITQIVSGCASKDREESIKQRDATLGLPEQHKVHFVEKLNDDESHVFNKRAWASLLGSARWGRTATSSRAWARTSSSSAR